MPWYESVRVPLPLSSGKPLDKVSGHLVWLNQGKSSGMDL